MRLRISGQSRQEINKKIKKELKLPSMKGYKEVNRVSMPWGCFVDFEKV